MIPNHQLISLSETKGIGPRKIRDILRRYPHIEDISDLSILDLQQIPRLKHSEAISIKNLNNEIGLSVLEKLDDEDTNYISYWSEEYPLPLKLIYDSPVGIFAKGKLDFSAMSIGVVGTRSISKYGEKVTTDLVSKLIEHKISIVSGFARGVDTIAHKVCILEKKPTIAVLGTGIDVCYPLENKKMFADILEYGTIITEFIPGTKPDAKNFPRRNRIISGLSKGIVVIEAANKSGALNTAFNALDQNRDVFAVPGNIFSLQSQGTHKLIQQGAKLVHHANDILEEYDLEKAPLQTTLLPSLTDIEKKVFNFLENDPIHIDKLSLKLDMDSPQLLSILLMLELKNLIFQHPGKYFSKS